MCYLQAANIWPLLALLILYLSVGILLGVLDLLFQKHHACDVENDN